MRRFRAEPVPPPHPLRGGGFAVSVGHRVLVRARQRGEGWMVENVGARASRVVPTRAAAEALAARIARAAVLS